MRVLGAPLLASWPEVGFPLDGQTRMWSSRPRLSSGPEVPAAAFSIAVEEWVPPREKPLDSYPNQSNWRDPSANVLQTGEGLTPTNVSGRPARVGLSVNLVRRTMPALLRRFFRGRKIPTSGKSGQK